MGGIKGSVLRIEKSSINDGDGLRTVLFLKGCPLHCLWCSTPESQSSCPERGLWRDKCVVCGACVSVCENGALSLSNGSIAFDREKCTACFKCASACPASAVVCYGSIMTSDEVVHELMKDEMFFYFSGGGVTLSGGEPLAQSDFSLEILKGCCDHGVNCAIESSFYAPWEEIEPLLPYLSLVHVDIKHADPQKHKELTGVDNGLILDNIALADASKEGFEMVVRTPLIPGINDADEDIVKLAEFVKGLRKLRHMEFLAYHRLGTETYVKLDRKYELEEIETPDAEYMKRKATLFKEISGRPVLINGKPL